MLKKSGNFEVTAKERNSNIELLRVIMILSVIAHHFIVNSGVSQLFDLTNITRKMIFMQFFGMWGKIAIDCFLLITGFFMCKSNATPLKWLKLFFEYYFYSLVINSLFFIFDYAPLGKISLQQGYIPFINNLVTGADSYPALFMTMFLFIPFLNKLINSMSKKEYTVLLCLLLFFFSIISTFLWRQSTTDGHWYVADNWEGLGWYSTVYFIGGYIRKHFPKKIDSFRFGLIASAVSITLSCLSIVLVDYSEILMSPYMMLAGANKFLAIATGISLFVLFKNLKMPNIKFINLISSATFGVLLIHANSSTMRYLLWKDLINSTEAYQQGGIILIAKVFAYIFAIYVVCVCIALFVNKLILSPIFNMLKRSERLTKPLYSDKKRLG